MSELCFFFEYNKIFTLLILIITKLPQMFLCIDHLPFSSVSSDFRQQTVILCDLP